MSEDQTETTPRGVAAGPNQGALELIKAICSVPQGQERPTLAAWLREHIFVLDTLRREYGISIPTLLDLLAQNGIRKADGEPLAKGDFERRMSIARKERRATGSPGNSGVAAAADLAAAITIAKIEDRLQGIERGLALGESLFAKLAAIAAATPMETLLPPARPRKNPSPPATKPTEFHVIDPAEVAGTDRASDAPALPEVVEPVRPRNPHQDLRDRLYGSKADDPKPTEGEEK